MFLGVKLKMWLTNWHCEGRRKRKGGEASHWSLNTQHWMNSCSSPVGKWVRSSGVACPHFEDEEELNADKTHGVNSLPVATPACKPVPFPCSICFWPRVCTLILTIPPKVFYGSYFCRVDLQVRGVNDFKMSWGVYNLCHPCCVPLQPAPNLIPA